MDSLVESTEEKEWVTEILAGMDYVERPPCDPPDAFLPLVTVRVLQRETQTSY